jgi:DNA-directed RNA polymerase
MLINKWNNFILPIHDCFGTHPNDMVYLAELVRETFVSLYSSNNFLKTIDDRFRQNLIDYKVKTLVKDGVEVVEIPISRNRNTYMPLPILPENGDLNINDVLTKGVNMIT